MTSGVLPEHERMNILLLTSDFLPNIGGMATHAHELARALSGNGNVVHLLHPVYGKGVDTVDQFDGITVHRLFIDSDTPKIKHYHYIRKTRSYAVRLIESMRAEVLHWHDLTPNCWTTRTLRRRLPLVWTNHTSNYLEFCETFAGRMKIRLWLSHADAVIAPSAELHEKSALTGISEERLHYIPNGVDAEKFKPGQSFGVVDKDFGLDPACPVVICPRRLEPKNGVEFLIRAVPLIRSEMPDTQFLVVGGGFPEERERFETFLADHGQRGGVVFTGNVPNASMPMFYALSTVSVLPSIMEATSISGLESMACGLPLVGTRVGGIPEIIRDGESGLLVEPRNPEAIAAAVLRLLRDAGLRAALGAGARKRVETEFAWPEIARRTESVYGEAIACRRKVRPS